MVFPPACCCSDVHMVDNRASLFTRFLAACHCLLKPVLVVKFRVAESSVPSAVELLLCAHNLVMRLLS